VSRWGFGGDQHFDDNGKPLSRGKLYFYETGSSTPKATYSNSSLTTENTWPVILDADGRQPDVFFGGAARLVIQSAAGVQIDDPDPVYPVQSTVTVVVGDEAGVSVESWDDLMLIESDTDFSTCTLLGFYAPGDGGGGQFYWDSTSTATPNIGTVVQPTATVGAGRWLRVFDEGAVSVKWFGAKGDGATDVAAAFQGAFDYVNSIGGGVVYMPPGSYMKDDAADNIWTMYSKTTLKGDGDCSMILFDDKASVVRDGNDMLDCSDTTDICFESFKIVGTALTELTETNQKQCLTGRNIERLRMHNVTIIGTRYMATAFRAVNDGIFTGNILEYITRDGIRAVNSWNIVISGNTFRYVADDAIAVHSIDEEAVPGSGVVISNNVLEGCQGIKMLGAKVCSITNNVLRRCIRTPIYIELLGTGTEGNSPMFAIDVSNNVITDTFRNLGTTQSIFIKQGLGRFDDGLSTMPSVTSDYTPYTYLQGLDGTTMPTIGQFAIRVSGNIISRTLGDTAAYSDYGYGELFDRLTTGFFSDPAITSATFGGTAIVAYAPVMGMDISNNNISGGATGNVAVLLRSDTSTNIQDYGNVRIHANTIFNCPGTGISIPDTGSGVAAKDIHITSNIIDLDPFFRNSSHAADNTWSATGVCVGLDLAGAEGVQISGNVFKNMDSTGVLIASSLTLSPNLIYADFIAAGDDAGNKGIRVMPVNAGANTIIKIDGDPTSPTYSHNVTVPYPYSNSMPASGYYLRGTFINKISPALQGTPGSQYILNGWLRATTGNSHVLDTDWIESRVLTGT